MKSVFSGKKKNQIRPYAANCIDGNNQTISHTKAAVDNPSKHTAKKKFCSNRMGREGATIGHGASAEPVVSRHRKVLYHSEYPVNLMDFILALKPLHILVTVGYCYSSLKEETEIGSVERYDKGDDRTNILMACDLFVFLLTEIHLVLPCACVQLIRHSFHRRHWKRYQYVTDYFTAFDVQVAFKDHRNKFFVERLFCGNRSDMSRGFLRERISEFFGLPGVRRHCLNSALIIENDGAEGADNDSGFSVIQFPQLHYLSLPTHIESMFPASDDAYNGPFTVMDSRPHSLYHSSRHHSFRAGVLVNVRGSVNRWGGVELHSIPCRVLGCYTHSSVQKKTCSEDEDDSSSQCIMYLHHKYDMTASFVISALVEQCEPFSHSPTLTYEEHLLPSHLMTLFTLARDIHHDDDIVYRVAGGAHQPQQQCSGACVAEPGVIDSGDGVGDDDGAYAESCIFSSLSSDNGDAVSMHRRSRSCRRHPPPSQVIRASLYHRLHELSWRCIALHSLQSDLLQKSYDENTLDWVIRVCGRDSDNSGDDECEHVAANNIFGRLSSLCSNHVCCRVAASH